MINSSFFLLVVAPLVAGVLTELTGRWRRGTAVLGTGLAFFLAWRIFQLPEQSWFILGREMVFNGSVRSVCILLYLVAGLFLLTWILPVGNEFVPGGLAVLSPLTVALMIRPFAFSALALVVAAALLVPVIQTGRAGYTRGTLRYLVIVVLAAPLFLLASWMLETGQQPLFGTASRLLGVGFVMLLAGFPFQLWVMPVVTDTSPLIPPLLCGLVQLVCVALIWQIAEAHPFLLEDETFLPLLQWSGVGTAVLGGLIVMTAQEFGRLWGGLVLLDMGVGLLAVTHGGRETAMALPTFRFVSLLLTGVGFALLSRGVQRDAFIEYTGLGWQRPLNTALFVYGCCSLLGMPFTMGFNGRWVALAGLASQSPWLPLLVLAAMTAGGYGLLRGLAILFHTPIIQPADS